MPAREEKNAFKRRLRKLLIVSLISFVTLLFLLILSLWIISQRFGGQLKEMALQEVNARLQIPVQVDKVRLSIWAHFPKIAIDLTGICTVEGKTYESQPQALVSEHIYLIFNPIELLQGNYRLEKIVLEKGELNLIVFWNGNDNYHFFRTDTSERQEALDLNFEDIDLKDFSINYRDLKSDQDHRFFIQSGKIRGNLKGDIFSAKASAGMKIIRISSGENVYLSESDAQLEADFKVMISTGRLEWNNSKLDIGDIPLFSSGSVEPDEENTRLKMQFSSEEVSVSDILKHLSPEINEKINTYSAEGIFSFNMLIEGETSDDKLPRIQVDWTLNNGSIRFCEDARSRMKDIKAEGTYDSGLKGDHSQQFVKVNKLAGHLNDIPLKTSFTIENFEKPVISGDFSTELRLASLPECWLEKITLEMDAQIAVNGSFRYDFMKSEGGNWSEALWLDVSGTIKDGSFINAGSGIELNELSATFKVKGDYISLVGIRAVSKDGSLLAELGMRGFISWLENASHELNIKAKINSESLPLAFWLEMEGDDTKQEAFWPENISADIDLLVNKLAYKNFSANGIMGQLHLENSILYARKLKMKTMKGEILLQAVLSPVTNGYQARSQVQLMQIDLSELFRQMDDFGQEDLGHKNLSGLLDANIDLAMLLDRDFMPSPASIIMDADMRISDGIISNYAPLQELPRFIKVGELKEVRIEPLQNHISIRDEQVIIPEMAVKTDAMNLWVSGTHKFDQRINYGIKVLLSELLGKKAKAANKGFSEFGWEEDDGLGRTTLYLRISGTSDHPEFSYDRKEVLKKIGVDLKEDRKELGKILGEEFKWLKRDSLEKAKKREERELLKRQENGEFILEWDRDSL